jgi:hypothetical protein
VSVKENASETSRAQVDSSPDRAYLIRCWQEGDVGSSGAVRWRFSVEEVLHEASRRGFADLDSLLDYLYGELTGESEKHPQRPDTKE